MLDHVYPVPVETASKDTRLGYKHVLHVVQSQELKAHTFEDICFVYLNIRCTYIRFVYLNILNILNWRKRGASNEVVEDQSRA